jgi:putative membrane protein (TIGR04086 family)
MSKLKSLNNSNFKHYLLSVLWGTLISAVCVLALSFVLVKNTDFNLFIKVMMYGSLLFGGFISGYYLNKKLKGRGIINGFFGGLLNAVFSISVIILILRFNCSFNLLLLLPVIAVGGALGGIICANK